MNDCRIPQPVSTSAKPVDQDPLEGIESRGSDVLINPQAISSKAYLPVDSDVAMYSDKAASEADEPGSNKLALTKDPEPPTVIEEIVSIFIENTRFADLYEQAVAKRKVPLEDFIRNFRRLFE